MWALLCLSPTARAQTGEWPTPTTAEFHPVDGLVNFAHTRTHAHRYLELQWSRGKNEIRFHYSAVAANGQLTFHTETFDYRLADHTWHKVALTVNGSAIQLRIDCNLTDSRQARYAPNRNFSSSASSESVQLLVGESYAGQYQLKVSGEGLSMVSQAMQSFANHSVG